ncbi:DUF4145 domain-containing protein [Lactiplantibacillus pentosus]|uniref:DUF4145 domain-containing protein n=1 Tax=Lactiplantibacillus pentosus TaxID=1589 RepID=UPI0021A5EEAF|nr:DUF4145 domain-containing protein [Lactiplantibacillus pentosus]MCT3283511.1 DUF4145 domain-containing protein [Lactiplantibacillus pentosus]
MQELVTVIQDGDICYNKALIKLPEFCPYCLCIQKPNMVLKNLIMDSTSGFDRESKDYCVMLFQCIECDRYFTQDYRILSHSNPLETLSLPTLHRPSINYPDFFKKISTVSPKFVEIYKQCIQAQNNELVELTGIGLRRAIEFLVKDYGIFMLNHSDTDLTKEKISKDSLYNAIQDVFKDDTFIFDLIDESRWIGNNKTHYTDTSEDDSINEMFNFIEAAANLIVAKLASLKARNHRNRRSKKKD